MPRTRKPTLSDKNIQGLKYFKRLQPLFASLHDIGVDPSGNRRLHYDQYASLILLFFFNPIITSLRGLQQASCLEKVQNKLGCPRTSLGAAPATAARAFDAEPLQRVIGELAHQALPLQSGKEAEVLRGLTAVDGSLLPALPKMAWALWLDEQHRAAKLHLHFDVFKGVPCYATVTDGNGNEKMQLRATLQPDRLYVIDRGYAEYQLFQDILDAKSSFIGRIRDNAVYQLVEERPLSEEARKAGVVRDLVVWLGGDQSGEVFKQPLRVVWVKTGKNGQPRPTGNPSVSQRPRRPGCRLDRVGLSVSLDDRAFLPLVQMHFGLPTFAVHLPQWRGDSGLLAAIASLLVSLWTGHKPTKRTFEKLCFYFSGWASEAELQAHVRSLNEPKKKKKQT